MRRLIKLLFCCLFYQTGPSQVLWIKNTELTDVALTAQSPSGDIYAITWKQNKHKVYRFDSNAVLISEYIFPEKLFITDLRINSLNDLLITGTFLDTLIFQNQYLIGNSNRTVFLASLDANFQLLWLQQYFAKDAQRVNSMAIDSKDNIFLCGAFTNSIAIGTFTLSAPGLRMFVTKHNKFGNAITGFTDDVNTDTLYKTNFSMAGRIQTNSLDEVLLVASTSGNYFAIKAYTVSNSKDGATLIYKFKADLTPQWGKSALWYDMWIAWEGREFAFNSNHTLEIHRNGAMGNSFASLNVFNNSGDTIGSIQPYINASNNTDPYFIAYIDDELYTSTHTMYYHSNGENHDHYICRTRASGHDLILHIEDRMSPLALYQTSSNSVYFTAILQDTARVAGVLYTNDTNKLNTLIIGKLGIELKLVGLNSHLISQNEYLVYPNPAHEKIYFTTNLIQGTQYRMTIYDAQGKTMSRLNGVEQGGETDISINNLASGIYFLRLETTNSVSVKKVIVK